MAGTETADKPTFASPLKPPRSIGCESRWPRWQQATAVRSPGKIAHLYGKAQPVNLWGQRSGDWLRRQNRAFSTIGSHATTIQTTGSRCGRDGGQENSEIGEFAQKILQWLLRFRRFPLQINLLTFGCVIVVLHCHWKKIKHPICGFGLNCFKSLMTFRNNSCSVFGFAVAMKSELNTTDDKFVREIHVVLMVFTS